MAVIDYESSPVKHGRPLQWLFAIVAGAVAGLAVAQIAFEPVLRFLSNGQQYVVFDVAEPFRTETRFTLAMVLGGVLMGISITIACHATRMRSTALWPLAFGAVFCVAASLGLMYARGRQSTVVGPGMPLASAPTLIAPLAGCAAVLLALSAVLLRRGTAARPGV